MRKRLLSDIEYKCRIRHGRYGTSTEDGMNGAFEIPYRDGTRLCVFASDGSGWKEDGLPGMPWEHVSVSTKTRCPTWEEMTYIKGLFWGDYETVIQFHPPRSQYVDFHPYCLHLWKPVGINIQLPPPQCVGPAKTATEKK